MPSSSGLADPSGEASTSGSYIDHTVSKLDTLAGVAIKYGIEVADVKRYNGLTTDLQMFALKTLRIPRPGRHPPSDPIDFKYENFTASAGLLRGGSQDLKATSNGKHKAADKTQDSSTMDLLRNYYGLPSGREDVEMATISSSNETDLDDECLLPIGPPQNATHSRRHSTGDFKLDRSGEFGKNLPDSSGPVQSSKLAQSRLLKSGKNLVKEGDESVRKVKPVRRRARGELNSDEALDSSERVNFPGRDPAPRPKDLNPGVPFGRFVNPAPMAAADRLNSSEGSSGIKTFGAALLGGKEAVEGLLSKVMTTASSTSSQEGGRAFSERVPSTGSLSVLEGITSVYRQAKSALD